MTSSSRGVALLEVMIALAIFSVAVLGAVERLAQLSQTQQAVHERERALADADRLMTAMSLLTRADLDLRLGRREAGPWAVEVQRPRPNLYRVAIGPADDTQPLLTTLLYRPEPARAP